MTRVKIASIVIVACALVVVAVIVTRATIFAGSSSSLKTGLCVRELRPGQPASETLTAQAENQTRALAQATPFGTPPPEVVKQSKALAQARREGGNTVIATVGDQPITLGAFYAQELNVRQLQAEMQTDMAPPGPPVYEKGLSERVKLIQQAGAPNVALAGLISDAAVYQYALEQGCQASPQEVSARVALDKALADDGHDPGLAMYASVYGPDYWTTIYPETIQHLLATNRLRAAMTASSIPSVFSTASITPPAKAWNSLNERLIKQAHVSVKDPNSISPATVSGALTYLKKYYAAGLGN